jgi:hypothetical protein
MGNDNYISTKILQNIKILSPALFPSWRFFDTVVPAPRIEYRILQSPQKKPSRWEKLYPKPFQVSLLQKIISIFWNPRWNEYLFLINCVESFIKKPTKKNEVEVVKLIKAELARKSIKFNDISHFKFRLLLLFREDTKLKEHIHFESRLHKYF